MRKIKYRTERDEINARLLEEAIKAGEKPVKAYERIYESLRPSQGLAQWLRVRGMRLEKIYKLTTKSLTK